MNLTVNNKIQICIGINFALLVIIASFVFNFADSDMLRIGYSKDLVVMGIVIDTWQKYLFLHVCFHLKKVDDLEIYELCQPSKDKLEEVEIVIPQLYKDLKFKDEKKIEKNIKLLSIFQILIIKKLINFNYYIVRHLENTIFYFIISKIFRKIIICGSRYKNIF